MTKKSKPASSARTLSILFIILVSLYLFLVAGFHSVYSKLFLFSKNDGVDHRTHRNNMFHEFSKAQYHKEDAWHFKREIASKNSANKILEQIKKDELKHDSRLQEEKETTIDEKMNLRKSGYDAQDPNKVSVLAKLSCEKYGGPDNDFARQEMVYWRDIPSDSEFVSPFKKHDKERYLTFEPDGGGWNNIRMAMETIISMAHAMGRTIVLPPSQNMYLLGRDRGRQNVFFTFADFFHLEDLASEHSGIQLITMQEFLTRTAMTGQLVNRTTGQVVFPPGNRTDWNGRKLHEKELWEYLRDVTDVRNWKPHATIAAFPSADEGAHEVSDLQAMLDKFSSQYSSDDPVSVDASVEHRLHEMSSGRKQLSIYDEKMQQSLVVHFMCYHKQRARMLTHFYTFLFFEDWRYDLWTKRFVRDHLRYIDELQCAAARIVKAIRERAKTSLNPNGLYDSMHIRRGDFQYKATRIEAQELLQRSQDQIANGTLVYIATDERQKDFFKPLKERYDLVFLDDFKKLIPNLNTNYYGMLDQLVASKGRVFFGTYFSTFSGYIFRIRGYYSTKYKLRGYERGELPNDYYFVPPHHKKAMHTYAKPEATFSREYPISWRDIDKGIEELAAIN